MRSLEDAKQWLRERLYEGAKCPCCQQMAKIYKRKVHSTMARALITLYRTAGREFAHGPTLKGDTHELSQLSWWGLIEEERILRPDGGRAGYWRVTALGEAFINNHATIPEYALIYDGELFRLEGNPRTIEDCLGSRFNYRQLLEGS